jgi:uncharacterized protein (DUF2236 family)
MDDSVLVTEVDLERQLSLALAATPHPLEGLFGPHSLTWRVHREAAVFLGAGRALLLQLAHPWIAAAIADHSSALHDPITRFHRTFAISYSMCFGTVDQALRAARYLYRRHAMIRGTLAEAAGRFPVHSPYWANEHKALLWVYATLTQTALVVHDLALPPLTKEDRERYYRESWRFAALFGLGSSSLPPDWTAFMAYNEIMWQSDVLTVTSAARTVAQKIFADTGPWPCLPAWYRAVTAQLLPPRIREAFGLRYGQTEQRAALHALAWIRRLYPMLPYHLRYAGPYQEAQARLSGRARPSPITQGLNKLWIRRRWLE